MTSRQASALPARNTVAGQRRTRARPAAPRRKTETARPGIDIPVPVPPESPFVRDSYASTAWAEIVDRSVHAAAARFTAGLSPMALIGAYMDWAAHLAFAPGKQFAAREKAVKKAARLGNYAGRRMLHRDGVEPCIEPLPQDRRFSARSLAAARRSTSSTRRSCSTSSGGTTR